MIEAPEARYLSEQLNSTIRGKRVTDVFTQYSPHKFAWFYGNPQDYTLQLAGKIIKKESYLGGSIYYCSGCQLL